MTDSRTPPQGWGTLIPGARTTHYYLGGFSVCNRSHFYTGPWHDVSSHPECKKCRGMLDAEDMHEQMLQGPETIDNMEAPYSQEQPVFEANYELEE